MTSTTARPGGRTLPGWLKTGLLAVFVFVLCWGGAIAWWRAGGSEPGAVELALVLLALPCVLLLALGLGKRLVPVHAAAAAASPAAVASAPAPAAAAPAAPPLAILAAALRSPHGASPEELAAVIAENKARPDLDPELVDDDGFPVTSARSPDAEDAALQEEIGEWLAANGMGELHLSEVQWRALILGTAVARDLAAQAVSERLALTGPVPALRLIPLLPVGWTVEQRSAAGRWFKHIVSAFGWPATELYVADVPATAGRLDTPAIVHQFALDSRAADTPLAALVIACASHIDQETVDEWAAKGKLFTPTRPQGLVPGEGAAGLLLTNVQGTRLHADTVFAQLHPLREARRDASLDEVKRVKPDPLLQLAQQAAQAAGLALSQVAAIAADTDQRANRGLELMGMASSALPQLDDTLDVASVGVALGACGAVPALAALALAHHHALAAGPVLFISHEDPLSCCAALVCPPPLAAEQAS